MEIVKNHNITQYYKNTSSSSSSAIILSLLNVGFPYLFPAFPVMCLLSRVTMSLLGRCVLWDFRLTPRADQTSLRSRLSRAHVNGPIATYDIPMETLDQHPRRRPKINL